MSDNKDKNKIRRRAISSGDSKVPSDNLESEKRRSKSNENLKKNKYPNRYDIDGDSNYREFDDFDRNNDIKMYNPRRSTQESRKKIIRESSYKNSDDDLKMYNPKRARTSQSSSKEKVEESSVNKKSKIRIKKQVSSGSESGSREAVQYKSKKPKKFDKDSIQKAKKKSDNIIQFKSNHDGRRQHYSHDEEYEEYDDYDESNASERSSLFRRIVKKLLIVLLVIFLIGGSASFLYVRSVVSDMPVLTKKMVHESYINKDPVPLSKIPKTLRNAVISIEDQRFYKHGGVDNRSLIRSFVNNLTSDSTQGGSTIDMQLSKNLLTNNERTMKRKIQDMYNAKMLNKIMTKDEILEAYLNNIYLGKSAYGVQAGSQLYFGKDVSNLTFGQSTMLAGITNNPGVYQDYEQAKKRQAVVLYKMYELGYIKEHVYKAQLYRDTPFKSEIDR
ncbi:MAG: biosynthetic peptidoglycan transglycosylase [Peptostreptococcus sp.]|uniref:biosynthetic peptidoglycan transglycosylase n=1 Tax=Peptostreptococcus sp. TaxID=1262 RepID=UPI002FC63E11